MIEKIRADKLLDHEVFVKEPTEKLSEEIMNNDSTQILLTGNKGSGKTTTLLYTEEKFLNSKTPIIYMQFDPVINFRLNDAGPFNREFFSYYYELVFSHKLLQFIKKNYATIFEKKFKGLESLLKNYLYQIDYYINRACYEDIDLHSFIYLNQFASLIVDTLKKELKCESLTLALDRFDSINGSDKNVQNILSNYFKLFDKIVLVCDDEKVNNLNNYSQVKINYGQNKEILKLILVKRLNHFIKNNPDAFAFSYEQLSDNIIDEIIKSKCSISLALDILNEALSLYQWHTGKKNAETIFDKAITKELETDSMLSKIRKKTTFYL